MKYIMRALWVTTLKPALKWLLIISGSALGIWSIYHLTSWAGGGDVARGAGIIAAVSALAGLSSIIILLVIRQVLRVMVFAKGIELKEELINSEYLNVHGYINDLSVLPDGTYYIGDEDVIKLRPKNFRAKGIRSDAQNDGRLSEIEVIRNKWCDKYTGVIVHSAFYPSGGPARAWIGEGDYVLLPEEDASRYRADEWHVDPKTTGEVIYLGDNWSLVKSSIFEEGLEYRKFMLNQKK